MEESDGESINPQAHTSLTVRYPLTVPSGGFASRAQAAAAHNTPSSGGGGGKSGGGGGKK